jgi:hypothetical protein
MPTGSIGMAKTIAHMTHELVALGGDTIAGAMGPKRTAPVVVLVTWKEAEAPADSKGIVVEVERV